MIPLWLFTLGRVIVGGGDDDDDVHITIPYVNITIILACYLVPVVGGLLIKRHCRRLSALVVRSLRPVYVVFILMMFSLGVWSNLYVFRLLRPPLLLAACLLPYVGSACLPQCSSHRRLLHGPFVQVLSKTVGGVAQW